MTALHRLGVTAVFATAMGYLEAAVVYYLRTMVNRIQPYQPDPLPDIPALALPELAREFATLVMLGTIGWLAGRTPKERLGFALVAFGVWDITYYLFLIPLTGWPGSVFDWDILFLIPLPWWGPVIAPVSIALLMIAFGVFSAGSSWPRKTSGILCCLGIVVALFVFMEDAIAALPKGEAAVRQVLPQNFSWALFGLAWVLMATPILDMALRYKEPRNL